MTIEYTRTNTRTIAKSKGVLDKITWNDVLDATVITFTDQGCIIVNTESIQHHELFCMRLNKLQELYDSVTIEGTVLDADPEYIEKYPEKVKVAIKEHLDNKYFISNT